MSDEVKPALTSEEWRSWPVPNERWLDTTLPFTVDADGTLLTVANSQEVGHILPEDRHKAAALCLHEQPFGFTREDIDALAWGADGLVIAEQEPLGRHDEQDRRRIACLRSLASRIAALLPPEP